MSVSQNEVSSTCQSDAAAFFCFVWMHRTGHLCRHKCLDILHRSQLASSLLLSWCWHQVLISGTGTVELVPGVDSRNIYLALVPGPGEEAHCENWMKKTDVHFR